MAKNVVFLVHGMGRHGAGWIAADGGPAATLSKVAEQYPAFPASNPLTNAIDFIEIRYDDIFDKILGQWAQLSQSLANLPEATPSAIRGVSAKLAGIDKPDNWFATHALDVAFYVGFKLVRRLVQLRVASQMMKAIADRGTTEDCSFGLIAHSLGTAIAHDAIHRMGTTAWLRSTDQALASLNAQGVGDSVTTADIDAAKALYGEKVFAPGKFKFEAIFMMSNTSVLLHQEGENPFESIVRPRFSGGGPLSNACLEFVNIDHAFDPIGKVKRFRAEEAWTISASRGTAKDVFNVEHIHDANVHGLDHYLIHPEVHSRILRAMVPHRFSAEEARLARARAQPGGDFFRWGDKYQDEDLQEQALTALEALKLRGGIEDLLKTLDGLRLLVDDIRGRLP